jgi:hypothetical protein
LSFNHKLSNPNQTFKAPASATNCKNALLAPEIHKSEKAHPTPRDIQTAVAVSIIVLYK